MSHLMMGRLMRCFIVESAFKNLIYTITVNNVANFIEMVTTHYSFHPLIPVYLDSLSVFLFVRWKWRVLIKIKING